MNGYEAINHQFGLWIALLESQCDRLNKPKVIDEKRPRFGRLQLHKAKPVYLSQLIRRDTFD